MSCSKIYAEGTPQWMPTGATWEMALVLFNAADGNVRLGTTGCQPEERIYIAVSNNFANERIYLGMEFLEGTANNTFFRVMRPDGTQIYPATAGTLQEVLGTGAGNTGVDGHIATLAEARIGPKPIAGPTGYDPITITPDMAGNYYIEFNGANSTTYSGKGSHRVSYFDMTIGVTADGGTTFTAQNGRLFSQQWSLYNDINSTGLFFVDAQYYVYQDVDSLVMRVDWDNVVPGGWNIAFTSTGLQDNTDLFEDRRSKPYTTLPAGSVTGEYPIFFSDPDPVLFPSATVTPSLVFFDYNRCSGSTCFTYQHTTTHKTDK